MYKIAATLAPTLLPSHQSHARYIKENVFDKLGLNSTTYSYAVANSTGEMADGITRDIAGEIRTLPYWVPDSGEDGNIQAGDGGIISSAADLAVWIQTLLLNGANPKTNETVIPADVIQRVATGFSVELGAGQFPEIGPLVYGAGQERGSYRGQEFVEHTGVVPGYRTVVSRYPNSNFGIAVLSNDDVVGQILIRIVQYYLADRIFGLDQVDWDSRYQALSLKSNGSKPTPRPANASFPYGDIEKLEGMYNNDGYDKMELCYVSSNSTVTGGSKSCDALRASVSKILPGIIQPNIPTFVAAWNATFVSHVVLKHFDSGLFNFSAVGSYPTGDPPGPYWVQDFDVPGLVEVDEGMTGIGLTGVWGAATGVPEPSVSTPKERVEVWFERL